MYALIFSLSFGTSVHVCLEDALYKELQDTDGAADHRTAQSGSYPAHTHQRDHTIHCQIGLGAIWKR
jgi:hypothetical protein